MLKRFLRQFLLILGEMEGEYRAFHLKDDLNQSRFYILIATLSVLGMLGTDVVLYKDRPDLVLWLLLYRVGFAFISILVIAALWKTVKVRVYDRLMLWWMSFVVLFLLFFNFT